MAIRDEDGEARREAVEMITETTPEHQVRPGWIDAAFSIVIFEPMTPHTRSGRSGKHIMCPICRSICKVYHFNWFAWVCQHCDSVVEKLEWGVEVRRKS